MNSVAHTSLNLDTRKETILQALDDIADIMNIGKLEGIKRAMITPEGKVESFPAIREKIRIIHREEQRYRQEAGIAPDTAAKVQAILS